MYSGLCTLDCSAEERHRQVSRLCTMILLCARGGGNVQSAERRRCFPEGGGLPTLQRFVFVTSMMHNYVCYMPGGVKF